MVHARGDLDGAVAYCTTATADGAAGGAADGASATPDGAADGATTTADAHTGRDWTDAQASRPPEIAFKRKWRSTTRTSFWTMHQQMTLRGGSWTYRVVAAVGWP